MRFEENEWVPHDDEQENQVIDDISSSGSERNHSPEVERETRQVKRRIEDARTSIKSLRDRIDSGKHRNEPDADSSAI
jgi:hypothetical protein